MAGGDLTSSIRFIADISQASGQMRALMAQAEQLDRVFSRVSKGIQQDALGPGTVSAKSVKDAQGKSLFNRPVALPPRREYDQFNQTLRTTYDSVVLNSRGQEVFRTSLTKTHGDMRLVTSLSERYGEASRRAALSTSQLNSKISEQRRVVDALKAPYLASTNSASAANLIANNPRIQREEATLAKLRSYIPQYQEYERTVSRLGDRAIARAQLAPPPLPASLETVRKESPNLFNRLVAGGLGKDDNGVFSTQQVYKQGGQNLQLTRDLERNVTQFRGTIRGLKGELVNVNAAYAEGGRVIGRYGGVLSGTQNFLRQTVNNFQKVVQWGLATTAVFAGIGLATSAFDTVKNLDNSLNQLGITAQLSSRQTAAVFDDLAEIAYNTATPLQEVVKAADDIALATKRANQSTDEWQESIKSLATSVGILTNITGLDTVKATDLLTSTMKQLNLETTDLTDILNKVTAVAGGQANSITDIVSGLGAMAEASQTAGLTLDETIGVVQVLGQVTSKSASEIATSFKNLVGSVDSVGGVKALDKFGISTRDAEGNLRNILEIYGEIQDKIRSGVIPEADIKNLVRGIAGGPRRAPDASALLANVDAIRDAQKRSANATNEALVANVKYLDTIESKITQLGVKFQAAIQKSLGPGIKAFVTDVANVLETLLDLLKGLDAGFIKTALQVTALIVGLKVLLGVGKFLGGVFVDIQKGLFLYNQAANIGAETSVVAGRAMQTSQAGTRVAIDQTNIDLQKQIAFYRQLQAAALTAGETAIAAEHAKRAAILEATAAGGAGAVGVAGTSRFSRLTSAFSLNNAKAALPALGIGAVSAGLSAATGSSLGQSVGAGLQGAGLTLLLGAPIPQAKALGAALAVVGTGLQFLTGETKKAGDATKVSSAEVLAAINRYTEAKQTISDLTKEQKDLAATYKDLTLTQDVAAKNTTAINGVVQEYTSNVGELVKANQALDESLKELTDTDVVGKFKTRIELAQSGGLSSDSLKALQKEIYESIFKDSNPELFLREGNPIISPSIISPGGIKDTGSRTATIPSFPNRGPLDSVGQYLNFSGEPLKGATEVIDLENLKDASQVLKLFSEDGKEILATFDKTDDNLDAIHNALIEASGIEGETGEKAKIRLATYENMLATLSAISNANVFVKQTEAALATQVILGQIKSDVAAIGNSNAKAFQDAVKFADQLPSERGRAGGRFDQQSGPTNEGGQRIAQELFKNADGTVRLTKLTVDEAKQLVSYYGDYLQLTKDVNELTPSQIAAFAEILGVQVQLTAEQQKQKEITEAQIALEESFASIKNSSLDSLASRNADIQNQFLNGDITKNVRDQMLAASDATKVLDDQMVAFFENIAGHTEYVNAFTEELSKIPGLENLVGKEADEAAALMVEFFNDMDLTSKGAKLLRDQVIKLIAALAAIPPVVVSTIVVNTVTGLSQSSQDAYSRFRSKEAPNADGSPSNTTTNPVSTALKDEINRLMKQIQNISRASGTTYKGLGGSKSAGSGATAQGPDVSQIDLPEELYGANQSTLIKEAIKRARALQKTIPGAAKEASNDVVSILKGTQNLLTVRGVKDDLLRRALEELADIEKKRLEFETKADTIRRIRVGGGDFSAIANVPVNSTTGISLGGSQGPINVTLNLNGTVLTPAQLAQFADLVAASLKRQIAG